MQQYFFFWSLDTGFPALESYNVFLAEEYRRGFDGYAHSMAEKATPEAEAQGYSDLRSLEGAEVHVVGAGSSAE